MPVPTLISELSPIAGDNSPLGNESPVILDNIQRAHAAFIAQLYAEREMPGVVKHYAGASAPAGWLACTGQAVSRTTYAALFAAIGTTWGAGDGTTTFNLPPADRMLMGAGVAYAVGATGGSKDAVIVSHTHTGTTGNESANHTHSGTTSTQGSHTHGVSGGSGGAAAILGTQGGSVGGLGAGAAAGNYYQQYNGVDILQAAGSHSHTFTTSTVSANHTHGFTTASAGVSGTNANLPPYAAMLLIIKY